MGLKLEIYRIYGYTSYMMMALRSTPLGNFLFMEALLPTPSSSYLPLKSPQMMIGNGVRVNYNPCSIFARGYPSYSSSCSFPFSAHNLSVGSRKSVSVIVRARKKDEKEDSHSFVPKPDEATGFFPEAVLLKEVNFTHVHVLLVLFLGFVVCCSLLMDTLRFCRGNKETLLSDSP